MAFIVSLGLAYLGLTLFHLPGGWRRGDFSIYYQCAVTVQRGLDPYRVDLNPVARELGFEPYPFEHPADTPAFTMMTEPLAWMRPRTAYAAWVGASTLCLSIFLCMIFGPSAKIGWRKGAGLTACALAFTPLADNYRWAQSQAFVLLGLLMFQRLVYRREDRGAGALLGMAGLLRGYPLVMGGYLLVRGRWFAVLAMAIAFAGGVAVTASFLGTGILASYIHLLDTTAGGRWFSLDPAIGLLAANISLDAFVSRPIVFLLGEEPHGTILLARGAATIVVKFTILAAAYYATRDGEDRDGRSFALWIATMLILTPLVWLHYLVVLILSYGLIAIAAVRGAVHNNTWRLAITSYSVIVPTTILMSFLSFHFRMDFTDWRVTAAAELGFPSLFLAWLTTYRFATER
ncbi:MAG: glycosyltransferase family 87 protein [Candidatus Binataceae bacterium]